MKVFTNKKELRRSELKEILKDENFKRLNKYDSKKYIILIHNEDNILTDRINYLSLVDFFGQETGLSFTTPSINIIDDYILVKFLKNIFVFESEEQFRKMIDTCLFKINNFDGYKLFRSQLVGERIQQCSYILGTILGNYLKCKKGEVI